MLINKTFYHLLPCQLPSLSLILLSIFSTSHFLNPIYASAVDPIFTNDGKHVYAQGKIVPLADPSTFKTLSHDLASDAKNVFLVGFGVEGGIDVIPLKGVDAKTFVVVDKFFVKDGSNVFVYPSPPSITPIPQADPKTFVSLKNGYGRDAKSLFYQAMKIEGADLDSLQIIEAENASLIRDKSAIYDKGKKISGADPKTFQILTFGWARDQKNIYHLSIMDEGPHLATVQPSVQVPSFTILGANYARDTSAAYSSNCHGPEVVRVENTVLPPWCVIPAADSKSFNIDFKTAPTIDLQRSGTFGFAKDSKRVYYEGAPIAGADPSTFQLLHSIGYARDKNQVYLREKIITGADPNTFELVDPENWITKDNKQTFYQERIK